MNSKLLNFIIKFNKIIYDYVKNNIDVMVVERVTCLRY